MTSQSEDEPLPKFKKGDVIKHEDYSGIYVVGQRKKDKQQYVLHKYDATKPANKGPRYGTLPFGYDTKWSAVDANSEKE